MNRIGLLGGMSWQSTETYYRLLNEGVQQRVGGHASAPVTVHSVDFAEIEALQRAGDWHRAGAILAAGASALERGGVQAVALATNTMHVVAGQITAVLGVPFIDLMDVVAAQVRGFGRVGLVGTGYTMAADLYPKRLATEGVEVIVPAAADAEIVHSVIFDELVHGVVSDASRDAYLQVIATLSNRGAQAVLLGCTEIGMLLSSGDADVPLLDTTRLHCTALINFIVPGESA